jgi:hypothetical protein
LSHSLIKSNLKLLTANMKFSVYTVALVIGLTFTASTTSVHGQATNTTSTTTKAKDILVAAVGDMLNPDGDDGVRGTNKTLAPTPPDTEPPVATPLTPFPTEGTVTTPPPVTDSTPPPVPDDIDTPSPTVRSILYVILCV